MPDAARDPLLVGLDITPAALDIVPATLDALGWTALVAGWVELARASRALPASHAQLRESIAPLITLEANTAALRELSRVIVEERPHARALAELSIREATNALHRLWSTSVCPPEILNACRVAQDALRLALYAGLEELVVVDMDVIHRDVMHSDEMHRDGGGAFVVPDLGLDFDHECPRTHRGTLACMAPGSLAMPGEPIAWWCERDAPTISLSHQLAAPLVAIDGETIAAQLQRRPAAYPRQVYRTLDEHGFFREDIVAPLDAPPPPRALPMLVPLVLDGVVIGRFLHDAAAWTRMQRIALNGATHLPVRVE